MESSVVLREESSIVLVMLLPLISHRVINSSFEFTNFFFFQEDKGLRLVSSKFTFADAAVLREHYSHIVSKPFFPEVCNYMTSAPLLLVRALSFSEAIK